MEIKVIGDIGFPSEVENVVYESPFRRLDCPGTSGFQVLHYFCYGFLWFSISGAFPDILEDVLFFSDNFQSFQCSYRKESQGEQGVLELSSELVLWSALLDKASGFPMLFPGQWCKTKSKRVRNKDQ